ncbi:MAG: hypothetical protein OHK006_09150 [Thermodesulfovibrionales bacterium]
MTEPVAVPPGEAGAAVHVPVPSAVNAEMLTKHAKTPDRTAGDNPNGPVTLQRDVIRVPSLSDCFSIYPLSLLLSIANEHPLRPLKCAFPCCPGLMPCLPGAPALGPSPVIDP